MSITFVLFTHIVSFNFNNNEKIFYVITMYLKRLKEIRMKNNLSQEEVAAILNISRATYTSFEIGRDTIPIERLNIFVNFFQTSFDYVLELSNIFEYQNKSLNIDAFESAKRLKETRKENKYTQDYVAKFLNTNHSVWCRYEQGKFLINTSFLYAYCQKINISADYLLGKVNSPKYLK